MLVLLDVGRITVGKFVREDAGRPDINLAVIFLLPLNQLWRHPADCANATGAVLPLRSELRRVAEIGKFNITLRVSQDIV